MRHYTLPDGTTTVNQEIYLNRWSFVGDQLKQILNVNVLAFDPDFTIKDRDSNAVHVLPLWVAQRIIDAV